MMIDALPPSSTSVPFKEAEYVEVGALQDEETAKVHEWGKGNFVLELVNTKSGTISSAAWSDEGIEQNVDYDQTNKNLEEALERQNFHSSIRQRISSLKRYGTEEGMTASAKSSDFLISFFMKNVIRVKPAIFLLDNGNFRAFWKGERGEQIGLQFLPDGRIQYVIFAQRSDSVDLARSYGVDTSEGINRLVELNRLRNLMYS